jgi:hypothetical protein
MERLRVIIIKINTITITAATAQAIDELLKRFLVGRSTTVTNSKEMITKKSSILSANSRGIDLVKGVPFFSFKRRGFTTSILPGKILPPATPAIIERKAKAMEIFSSPICCTRIFQRIAFRDMFAAVRKKITLSRKGFTALRELISSSGFMVARKASREANPTMKRIILIILGDIPEEGRKDV